jgi:hypothetical protein
MTRQERTQELIRLMHADFAKLVEIYQQAMNIPKGTTPPTGVLVSQMMKAILSKEFPQRP